ncbi:M48 family metallopeptidase [Thetidibacter halocola]|uniref:M48 family metallopeptidase n=1 Tax=Thetidibacter halocola TaxID=2827239 RepID=A0A8J7WC02_9RHOB|nr:M48 family metallopeptidase [Thetidibacter halocola]
MTGFETRAIHFDGQSAEPRDIRLQLDPARRSLTGPGVNWPLDEVREVPDQGGADLLILRRADDAVQRLILPDRSLAAQLPRRTAPVPAVQRRQIWIWAAAAVASVALIVFVLVPKMADQLAVFIPPEGERALGEVTLSQIRSALDESGTQSVGFCTAPAGLAALQRMEARLAAAMPEGQPLSVHVLDHKMVNAFALPGGYVVFFRGLIDEAGSPEEVAAVFAHEIGHVVSRDPTRHALRSAGSIGVLGLVFGDFAGGALVLFLAERLIDAQYSQSAEAAADAFAADLLLAAGLPPDALAEMFERFRRLGGDDEGIMAHFMAHPRLGDRIAAARTATPPDFAATPLLNDDEWRALKAICG